MSSINRSSTSLILHIHLENILKERFHLKLNYFIWMSKFFFQELPLRFPDFYRYFFYDFADGNFCKEFDDVMMFIRNEPLMMRPSDALISKVLLGIWGQAPAFDSQFKSTAKIIFSNKHPILLNLNFLKVLYEYADKYELDKRVGKLIFSDNCKTYEYPLAKKMDMIFWFYSQKNNIFTLSV